jgi:hypothetical protein
MSYATVDDLREYLAQDAATGDKTLQRLLDRANDLINEELGFAFDGAGLTTSLTRYLNPENDDSLIPRTDVYEIPSGYGPIPGMTGIGNEYLYLPAPGATSIASVTENGTPLTGSDYELDPRYGKFLLRVDSTTNYPRYWANGRRNIAVVYRLRAAPAGLVQAELVEAVRIWRAKDSAFADVVGVDGSNAVAYSKALSVATLRTIQSIQRHYGDGGMAGA